MTFTDEAEERLWATVPMTTKNSSDATTLSSDLVCPGCSEGGNQVLWGYDADEKNARCAECVQMEWSEMKRRRNDAPTVWHHMPSPGVATCGADYPNMSKSANVYRVNCLRCLHDLITRGRPDATPRDAVAVVAALVQKAGGEVKLTDSDLRDAFGLTLDTFDPVMGGRTFRTHRRESAIQAEDEAGPGDWRALNKEPK